MVGFSGVMKALYESGVLDCATYVAGLSGSTWSVKVECLVFFFKTDAKIPWTYTILKIQVMVPKGAFHSIAIVEAFWVPLRIFQ